MDVGRTAIEICFVMAVVAAIWDFFFLRIPNILTLGGIVLGLSTHACVGWVDGGVGGAFRGLGVALLGMFICGIVPLLGFARNEMGGGDVKMLAAVGALCGPIIGLHAEAFGFLIVFATVIPWRALTNKAFREQLHNMWFFVRNCFRPKDEQLPYIVLRKPPRVIFGPSILLGLSAALLHDGFRP